MAKVNRGFVLSYQANTNLYDKYNVKNKIIKVLVINDAIKLHSYTDSTIYFILPIEEGNSPLVDCKKTLDTGFKNAKISSIHYTLSALWFYDDNSPLFDVINGDSVLNGHFQKIVAKIREKENKPEKTD